MDKYDKAIEFLQEQGGYHEECAELIQELLHIIFELEAKPIHGEAERFSRMSKGAKSWHLRDYRRSPAKELSE